MDQTTMKRSIVKEAKRIKYESRTRATRFIRDYSILALICCAFIIVGVSFYRHITHLLKETAPLPETRIDLRKTIMHLDLKGAPPDMKYLRQIMQHIADLGVTGILLEYEDMFHYKQDIKNLSSPYHYHDTELMMFINRATSLKLEVIPLIQTFGHMEHALKLEEFQHLREDPLYPDSICPSKNGSLNLLKKMIGQVVLVHKQLTPFTTIHIGGGEVHHLNTCPDCTKRGLDSSTLYIEHIKNVAKMVKPLAPDVTIMVWDDMFRRANITDEFKKQLVQLGKEYRIQPVVWDFSVDLSHISREHMKLYQTSFKNMWIASAYKGVDGAEAIQPDLKRRLLNSLNWLKFASEHQEAYNFSGLILTGRSRYSHLQPPCELLPLSYKSLFTTVSLIHKFRNPHRIDSKSMRYTLKDWKLADARYFKSILESAKRCKTEPSVYFRTECKLMNNDTMALHDNMRAYADAVRRLENFLDTYNIAAKVAFGYVNRNTITEYLTPTNNLTEFFSYRMNMLKKSLRMFYSENIYRECILYKFYSVIEKENYAIELLQKYVDNFFPLQINQTLDDVGPYMSWPRGRNFTMNN